MIIIAGFAVAALIAALARAFRPNWPESPDREEVS